MWKGGQRSAIRGRWGHALWLVLADTAALRKCVRVYPAIEFFLSVPMGAKATMSVVWENGGHNGFHIEIRSWGESQRRMEIAAGNGEGPGVPGRRWAADLALGAGQALGSLT